MLLQLSKTVKQSPKSPQIFENNGAFCADRPFSKNRSETNCQKSFVFNQLVSELQSYILSTTTETRAVVVNESRIRASIVHPFNNNWNQPGRPLIRRLVRFNRTSFQQQLKRISAQPSAIPSALQSYILSTTTETESAHEQQSWVSGFNRTSFQQQLKLERRNTC